MFSVWQSRGGTGVNPGCGAAILVLTAALASACGGTGTADEPAEQPAALAHAAAIRVQAMPATTGTLHSRPHATGMSRSFRRATVSAETGGRVIERRAEAGDEVEAGDPILVLDQLRPTLARDEARAGVITAETDLAEAERDLKRGDDLAAQKAISDSELDRYRSRRDRARAGLAIAQARAARAEQDLLDATIRAPFNGTVERVDADVGDLVNPGTPVAVVVDLARVRVRAGVTANEAARLHAGQPASLIFDAGDGRERRGRVRSVGRLADARSGTYSVEIWLENSDRAIRDGMTARVEFDTDADRPVLLIPRAALARSGSGVVAFVVEGEGTIRHARRRAIRLGRSDDEHIEVTGGLDAGELVITDGHFALDDGAPITLDRAAEG